LTPKDEHEKSLFRATAEAGGLREASVVPGIEKSNQVIERYDFYSEENQAINIEESYFGATRGHPASLCDKFCQRGRSPLSIG
jgi:hypothetical protein